MDRRAAAMFRYAEAMAAPRQCRRGSPRRRSGAMPAGRAQSYSLCLDDLWQRRMQAERPDHCRGDGTRRASSGTAPGIADAVAAPRSRPVAGQPAAPVPVSAAEAARPDPDAEQRPSPYTRDRSAGGLGAVIHAAERFADFSPAGSGTPAVRFKPAERRLDAARDRQQAAVAAVLADDHQPDRRFAGLLDRHRRGAAVEEIDRRAVAQDQRVQPAVIGVVARKPRSAAR